MKDENDRYTNSHNFTTTVYNRRIYIRRHRMTDVSQLEMKLHKLTDKLGRIVSRMEILEKKIVEHNDKLETLHKELEEVREKV